MVDVRNSPSGELVALISPPSPSDALSAVLVNAAGNGFEYLAPGNANNVLISDGLEWTSGPVVPEFGAQNIVTTGNLLLGAQPATLGRIRFTNGDSIRSDDGLGANVILIDYTNPIITIGSNSASLSTINFGINSGRTLSFTAAGLTFGSPPAGGFMVSGGIDSVGQPFRVRATGASAFEGAGGQLRLQGGRAGSGGVPGGVVLQANLDDTTFFAGLTVSSAGAAAMVGLYSTAAVAQQTDVGAMVDSTTGTPSGTLTLVDVGAVPTQANINNNFATSLVQINAIRTRIRNIGITA